MKQDLLMILIGSDYNEAVATTVQMMIEAISEEKQEEMITKFFEYCRLVFFYRFIRYRQFKAEMGFLKMSLSLEHSMTVECQQIYEQALKIERQLFKNLNHTALDVVKKGYERRKPTL